MRVFLLENDGNTLGWAFGPRKATWVLLIMTENPDDAYIWTTPGLLEEYGGRSVELDQEGQDARVPVEIWQKLDEVLRKTAEESMALLDEAGLTARIARLSNFKPSVRVHG